MKRISVLLSVVLFLVIPIVSSGNGRTHCESARGVVARTFGSVPDNLRFKEIEKCDGHDRYALSVCRGVLTVEGSSVVAMCKGFHDYILENGYGIASWTGNRLDLPSELVDMRRKEVVSPFENGLYYNVCTYGYTTPFWGWSQWEKEIDWMALHGFDMPLAPIAGEAVLSRVWSDMGLSQDEIDAYFTGPAHFPWMRMGNMTHVDGGMSRQWHRSQIALQHKILDRMYELGMDPVCQGFAGFVPKAFMEHWPKADFMTTKWYGHESYMLSPVDSLFSVVGTAFVREWEREFGKGKYYLIDSFNELDIPFGKKGSRERADKLRHYSETIYSTLSAVNPDAVWVMQGWMFGYSREMWDKESVRALLSGAPDDRMMIIDLAVDFNNYVWKNGNSWDNLDGFFGKRWIWSTTPNFGGRTALKGPLEFYLNGHLEALRSSSKGCLIGFGTSPEGVENNEIIYELISSALWSSESRDIAKFLQQYSRARYGANCREFDVFWDEMRKSVYDNFTNNARFRWQQRPAYHRAETMNINEHYFRGIESFLAASDRFKDNELYRTDAIQYAALYLAAKADFVLKSANWAVVAGDREKVLQLKGLLTDILKDIDRLLESHPILRMQRWLDFADACATGASEKQEFAREAKRLVSVWSGPSLKDYSSRVWSGLIRDYYIPRLDYYFTQAADGNYADMVRCDNRFHEESLALSSCELFENPLEAALSLVRKYSGISEENLADAFWCPQDFAEKTSKRFYFSVAASDFVKMKGLKISGVRGADVKISKVEFKSGPFRIGTFNMDRMAAAGEEVLLPFDVPQSTGGMEREVAVYVTIEGGPQSWGLISLMK